ncbi:hypothetical protein [Streptomyces sp. 6-11-2]|uniref:hypothetical protein n=1 Tax=Streptomyces sp. 6-11-2 TaxID=2585753 RepID=UPI0011448134|nr:hypothetical protein [Streptomyces sp. 6-11-2]GED88831.1 hypothetical protein TNCT6_59160 [Streptomyces sp. 6-11-2]
MSEVYPVIEAEKTTHNVALLCRLLRVACSSFYAWPAGEKARSAGKAADDALAHEITVLHVASKATYRVPRKLLVAELVHHLHGHGAEEDTQRGVLGTDDLQGLALKRSGQARTTAVDLHSGTAGTAGARHRPRALGRGSALVPE